MKVLNQKMGDDLSQNKLETSKKLIKRMSWRKVILMKDMWV